MKWYLMLSRFSRALNVEEEIHVKWQNLFSRHVIRMRAPPSKYWISPFNFRLNIWNHFVIISFLQVYACFMCAAHICGFSTCAFCTQCLRITLWYHRTILFNKPFVYDFHVCQKSLYFVKDEPRELFNDLYLTRLYLISYVS